MMHILAVDDDPVILDLLRGSLTEEKNYKLTCAASAEDALDIVRESPRLFDCFLVDIMLPGVDGIEMCEMIRACAAYRSTPILMMTASREAGLMQRAFFAGATDYISKPLEGVELGARINSAGLLNASLLREREAQHTLGELTALVKVRFEEPFKLDVPGMSNLLQMENHLLRLQTGCYAMNLFSIEAQGMKAAHANVSPPAFRNAIEQLAEITLDSLNGFAAHVAYVGSGRFLGLTIGRRRLDLNKLRRDMTQDLARNWDEETSQIATPPKVRVASVGNQRYWSGMSASEKLRETSIKSEPFSESVEEEESNLFAKFESYVDSRD